MSKLSEAVVRIAVPFFGGFLGSLAVALVSYCLGIVGISKLVGMSPPVITQQWLQNFSWGGAMWGLLAAAFLVARKGNVYLIALLTTIVAVTYGLFVLQGLQLALPLRVVYAYVVNLTYALVLALTIRASRLAK